VVGRCPGLLRVDPDGTVAGMQIEVVRGDITRQQVGAIVNAANRAMRGGGGVDGAIHRAGGPVVLADCIERFPNGLATGDAGWTTAGNLSAQWVIHVVGPNYGAGEHDRNLLTSCYSRALEVADGLGARTLAFPLISAGIYAWPLYDAAAAAIETLRHTATQVDEARVVAFGDAAYDALAVALARST
jgi:O-acetyl-ADP-ribose deacetylase